MNIRKLLGALAVSVIIPTAAYSQAPKPQMITLAAAPSVISLYAVIAGLGSMIEKEIPGSRVTVVEGGTVSNVLRLTRNQVQMAYSKPGTLYAAQNGTGKPFEKPNMDALSVAGITSGPLHIAVDARTGIRTFDDIVNKKYPLKITVGSLGLSSEVFFRQILEVYGLTYADIKKWGGDVRLVGTAEGLDSVRNGQVDAITTPDILPHPGITQIAQSLNVNLVSISDEVIQKLSDKYGYSRSVIPAGTYRGVNYDVVTLDDPYIIIAHKDLPEDFIYATTKAFLSADGRKFFDAISTAVSKVDNKEAFGMLKGTKMHPGAEKYFTELGLTGK